MGNREGLAIRRFNDEGEGEDVCGRNGFESGNSADRDEKKA